MLLYLPPCTGINIPPVGIHDNTRHLTWIGLGRFKQKRKLQASHINTNTNRHTPRHIHTCTHTQPTTLSQNPWVLKYLANNSVDCLNTCPGVLEKHLLSPHKLQTCGRDAGLVKLAESVNEADRRPQRWICALHLPKVIMQTAEVATEHRAAFSLPPPKARPPGKRNIEALQKTNQIVYIFFHPGKKTGAFEINVFCFKGVCILMYVCVWLWGISHNQYDSLEYTVNTFYLSPIKNPQTQMQTVRNVTSISFPVSLG